MRDLLRGKQYYHLNQMKLDCLFFGDTDLITKSSNFYDAYAIAFLPEKKMVTWATAVGEAPRTNKSLEPDKVTHNSESNPT